jgi:uroporphyrinogen-III synthase
MTNGALHDKSVVITRSISQNESLRQLLEARGAHVVEVPLIAIAEPEDEGRERDAVLQKFQDFDWIVVTSPNGAERIAPFIAAAQAAGDATHFPHIASVGEATSRVMGMTPTLEAEPARANVLASMFPEGMGSVCVVQGNLADSALTDAITAKGWNVTRVVAYQTVHLRPPPELMTPALASDLLLLASGSAATAWFDSFGTQTPPLVVTIGPETTKVAQDLGIEVSATAPEQTLWSLIDTADEAIAS